MTQMWTDAPNDLKRDLNGVEKPTYCGALNFVHAWGLFVCIPVSSTRQRGGHCIAAIHWSSFAFLSILEQLHVVASNWFNDPANAFNFELLRLLPLISSTQLRTPHVVPPTGQHLFTGKTPSLLNQRLLFPKH